MSADGQLGAEELMVRAAERIGAERGLGAMSLRAVQAEAGQRNKSAAQYHFGTRDGLVEAVIAARMGPINRHRALLLAELDHAADLAALAEVLVRPLAQAVLGNRPSFWARFLLQGYADPSVQAVVRGNLEGRVYREVREQIVTRLDHVPEVLRTRRVDHAVGLLVLSLAAAEDADARGVDPGIPVEMTVRELVDVCTAVLAAPTSGAPASMLAVEPGMHGG